MTIVATAADWSPARKAKIEKIAAELHKGLTGLEVSFACLLDWSPARKAKIEKIAAELRNGSTGDVSPAWLRNC